MSLNIISPRPIFADLAMMGVELERYDKLFPLVKTYLTEFPPDIDVSRDFELARSFLADPSRAVNTFGNYRNYVERLLLWSWIYQQKSVLALVCADIREFVDFNHSPPQDWVGPSALCRFLKGDAGAVFNKDWRPMCYRLAKSEKTSAQDVCVTYKGASTSCIGQLMRTCSSFFNFLIREGVSNINPIAALQMRASDSFSGARVTARGFSAKQWQTVVEVATSMADASPKYERSLFLVTATCLMYLRRSDLSTDRCENLTMGVFVEQDGNWWLELPDRFNAQTKISVTPAFLPFLTRYRKSRGLSSLPSPGETTPLLTSIYGRPGLTGRHIFDIIQKVFDNTYVEMRQRGEPESECLALMSASVSWLRDTGARLDAQHRSPSQLQVDLRHVCLANTINRYY